MFFLSWFITLFQDVAGCTLRKHVGRASHDRDVVPTGSKGSHDTGGGPVVTNGAVKD